MDKITWGVCVAREKRHLILEQIWKLSREIIKENISVSDCGKNLKLCHCLSNFNMSHFVKSSVSLKWDMRFCYSNKLPEDYAVAGPWTTLCIAELHMMQLGKTAIFVGE